MADRRGRAMSEYTGPPAATQDGQIVLYRMPGDVWNVARDESEIEYLTGLSIAKRAAQKIEVLLVTPEEGAK